MTDPSACNLPPEEIERRSFAIIADELGDFPLPPDQAPVVKRVIHATADFEYARTLQFSETAVADALAALRKGCPIVTDTQMAKAGINKRALGERGGEAHCYIADADVAADAARLGCTRSRVAVDKAVAAWGDRALYVVGNAPTALARICEHIRDRRLKPALVVGVPVGFVNVVESKDLLIASGAPHIVARGRKGGSTVAAAICNALLYMIKD